jgi:hypothetical protein
MNARRRLGIVIVVLLALGGCGHATTNIGDITSKSAEFLGKEVTVAGEVTSSAKLPFVPAGYAVQDGTGQMAVVTGGELPPAGTKVRIRARVEAGATIGGKAIGLYLRETRRY